LVENVKNALKNMKHNTTDNRAAKIAVAVAMADGAMVSDQLIDSFAKRLGITWRFAKDSVEYRRKIDACDSDDPEHPWIILKRQVILLTGNDEGGGHVPQRMGELAT
jgi:hypothetical protein